MATVRLGVFELRRRTVGRPSGVRHNKDPLELLFSVLPSGLNCVLEIAGPPPIREYEQSEVFRFLKLLQARDRDSLFGALLHKWRIRRNDYEVFRSKFSLWVFPGLFRSDRFLSERRCGGAGDGACACHRPDPDGNRYA